MALHLVFFMLLVVQLSRAELSVSYSCIKDSKSERFSVTAKYTANNEFTLMLAGSQKCSFIHDVQMRQFTKTFVTTDADCAAMNTPNGGTIWKVNALAIGSTQSGVFSQGKQFELTCDFNKASPTTFNATFNQNITGSLPSVVLNVTSPCVNLQMFCYDKSKDTFVQITVPTIGQQCFLKACFGDGCQGAAVGLMMKTCVVSPDATVAVTDGGQDRYLTKDGCGAVNVTGMGAGVFKDTDGWKWNAPCLESSIFSAFRFAFTPGTIFINCNMGICYNTSDCIQPTCESTTTGSSTGRRKRSVIESEEEQQDQEQPTEADTLGAFQVIPGDTTSNQEKSQGDRTDTGNKAENCLDHMTFIIVAVVFLLLLILVMAVAIFFCMKLHRRSKYEKEVDEYSNSGYRTKSS